MDIKKTGVVAKDNSNSKDHQKNPTESSSYDGPKRAASMEANPTSSTYCKTLKEKLLSEEKDKKKIGCINDKKTREVKYKLSGMTPAAATTTKKNDISIARSYHHGGVIKQIDDDEVPQYAFENYNDDVEFYDDDEEDQKLLEEKYKAAGMKPAAALDTATATIAKKGNNVYIKKSCNPGATSRQIGSEEDQSAFHEYGDAEKDDHRHLSYEKQYKLLLEKHRQLKEEHNRMLRNVVKQAQGDTPEKFKAAGVAREVAAAATTNSNKSYIEEDDKDNTNAFNASGPVYYLDDDHADEGEYNLFQEKYRAAGMTPTAAIATNNNNNNARVEGDGKNNTSVIGANRRHSNDSVPDYYLDDDHHDEEEYNIFQEKYRTAGITPAAVVATTMKNTNAHFEEVDNDSTNVIAANRQISNTICQEVHTMNKHIYQEEKNEEIVEASFESRGDEIRPGAYFAAPGHVERARSRDNLLHRCHSNEPSSLLSQTAEGEEENHVELQAVVVDKEQEEKELKESLRRELADEVVVADSVEKIESPQKRRTRRIICALLAIAAVVVITVLTVALTKKDDDNQLEEYSTPAPTLNPDPMLKQITEAGVLKCYAVYSLDIAFCKALAAAIFGPVDLKEKIHLLSPTNDGQASQDVESFAALANGTIDAIFGTIYTMERDFQKDKSTGVGFTFTTPYIYDGLTFGGFPEFVDCADELDTFGKCSNLRICIVEEVDTYDFLQMRLPTSAIVPVLSREDMLAGLMGGKCNVVAGIYTLLAGIASRYNLLNVLALGKKMHIKAPLSSVTRDNDPEWSDFVNAVMQSFWAAYATNITRDTADKFSKTSLFGDEFENMFIDAIREGGNAKEGLDRKKLIPQPDMNEINRNGSTGLIYSLPFDDTQKEGPGPVPGGKLEKILKRGKLLCGILPNRPGFAYYNTMEKRYRGMDVDYCHAIASSIFRSNRTAVDFVPFDAKNTSNVFGSLLNGSIDIAAGVGYTLERDVREPSTGEGFTFSTPYFYNPPEGPLKEALSLVTCQDDPQWSAVVYWIVMSTFYAEENNWTHDLSYSMPLVDLLGPYEDHDFRRMFRDAVLVGNYGELYERNVEQIIPRGGRNRLNKDPLGPQLNPYIYFDI